MALKARIPSALLGVTLALSAVPGGAKPRREPEPPPDTRPKVALTVSLSESGPDKPWILKVRNSSSAPAKVVDDPRLLWLEVARPGKAKPKECRLPETEATREAGEKRLRELKPGESLLHPIDPRFYCFSPGKQEVLVPSAQVTPHYGFPDAKKPRGRRGKHPAQAEREAPPFVGAPSQADGPSAPVKNVAGDPVILDGAYAEWTADPEPPRDEPSLEISRGSDADTERSVTATVRIRNSTKSRLRIFFRRELLTFTVVGLRGKAECPGDEDTKNPDRGSFNGIGAGGSLSVTSRLVELCPRGTFAESGLYLVSARFRGAADGGDYGFEAFTGTIETKRPAPVRVRKTIRLEPVLRKPAAAPGASLQQPQPGAGAAQTPAPAQAPAAPAPPPPPPPQMP